MRLSIVLCAIAVCVAQVFGVVRGFQCDCGGVPQMVDTDCCSGPHGAGCHSGDSSHDHAPTDGENSADRKQHTEVKDDINGTMSAASAAHLPAPIVAILPEFLCVPAGALAICRLHLRSACIEPPPSATLKRTVVLRI